LIEPILMRHQPDVIGRLSDQFPVGRIGEADEDVQDVFAAREGAKTTTRRNLQ
jgi:hypothetical protein